MAFAGASGNMDRAKSAVAVVALHALAGYALLNAFDIRTGEVVISALTRLNVIDVPIAPVIADEKPKQATPEPEGAASAANLNKTSAPREAPKRIVEIPIVFHDRTEGESKMSRNIVREAVWMVWRLRWWGITGRVSTPRVETTAPRAIGAK